MRKLIKSTLLTTCLATAVVQVPTASAEVPTGAKRAGVLTGSFVTGAAAGGPVGAVLGMLTGAWLSVQVEEADRLEAVETQLAHARQRSERLSGQLQQARDDSRVLARQALDQLQLALMFHTGDSQLTPAGERRIAHLAGFLVDNPALAIRLDGYADPRGAADYNMTLSDGRVQSVAQRLVDEGVDADRIHTFAHGASESSAEPGDHDAYALERVVRIQLTRGERGEAVAQVTVGE